MEFPLTPTPLPEAGRGNPLASVLIVNYNGGRRLLDCLQSLEEQTLPRYQFEVIVVDNASKDDSLAHAEERFPNVRYIRHPRNAGFAEGNNIAARQAKADIVVLLNNDTIADPFWLEELLYVMNEQHADAAVSKLVFADDPTLINSGGLMLLRDGRGSDAGFRMKDDGRFETMRPVFAGCGAALALRKTSDVLDGSLFLYYEDLDAGWRLQQAGKTVLLAPRSLVRHAVGSSGGDGSPVHRFHVERNRALLAWRHGDLFLALYSIFVLIAKVPQAMLRLLTGRSNRRQAMAVPHAALSFLWRLPETITQRYLNRCWRLR
ncbi:hypothetical protein BH11PLA2_BH11PLA2_21940 [soil metagenome]